MWIEKKCVKCTTVEHLRWKRDELVGKGDNGESGQLGKGKCNAVQENKMVFCGPVMTTFYYSFLGTRGPKERKIKRLKVILMHLLHVPQFERHRSTYLVHFGEFFSLQILGKMRQWHIWGLLSSSPDSKGRMFLDL